MYGTELVRYCLKDISKISGQRDLLLPQLNLAIKYSAQRKFFCVRKT